VKVVFAVPFFAAALMVAAGAFASEDGTGQQAEDRLRGCLLAGSSAAPRTSLAAALQSTRAFCRPQINALAQERTTTATAGLDGVAAEDVRKQTLRQLNNEIAYAVANFTGLHH
jgi:hypothetical protein